MVVGALTGAATGLALDLGERGAARAAVLSGAAVDHAPQFAGHVRQVVSDAITNASDHPAVAEVPARAKSAVSSAQEKVVSAAVEGRERAADVANQGKELLVGSLGHTHS
jgi:hypothetical protein